MTAQTRTLLIVWHSRTGASRQLAMAAARGATESLQEDGACARAIHVDCLAAPEVDGGRMRLASAYIFIAPENLGSLSGAMKEFFDRTYYEVIDQIAGRPYATVISAGSDGQGAARQVARIATGWRLKPVAEPMIVITQAQTAAAILRPKHLSALQLEGAAELGAALAQGIALGIY